MQSEEESGRVLSQQLKFRHNQQFERHMSLKVTPLSHKTIVVVHSLDEKSERNVILLLQISEPRRGLGSPPS